MEFEPKQKNKVADIAVLCLFLCAAVCVVFGNINGISGKGVLQLVSLVFFCAMIFVLVKYKFTRIRYTIRRKAKKGYGSEDSDDCSDAPDKPVTAYPPNELELYIESAQGRRLFVGECLVGLDTVVCCTRLPDVKSEKKKLEKQFGKLQTYRYLKNPVASDKWLLVAKTELGKVRILFEPDEKMAGYLTAVAAYNAENKKKSSEQ